MLSIFAKNPKRLHRIQLLGEIFKEAGHEIRIAGGAVRDILRGEEPTDIDFATTSPPKQSLKILEPYNNLMRIITTETGMSHGTVAVKFKGLEDLALNQLNMMAQNKKILVDAALGDVEPVYDDESPFEITTLRCDSVTDGRHAEVKFISDWKLDAERRDLTINAMFLTVDTGEVIDYFGGQSDLKEGFVRFVGNADDRITEDYLRILRFFRFWSRYGQNKRPDEETLKTIGKNLDGLEKISGERIWVEIKKIFSHIPAHETVQLLLELDLFAHIGIYDKEKIIQIERVTRDLRIVQNFISTYSQTILKPQLADRPTDTYFKKMKEILPVILLSTVFETNQMCLQAHKRLKFSNLERDTLIYIVDNRQKDNELITLQTLKSELVKCPRSEIVQTRNRMSAFLVYMGRLDLLNDINDWVVPKFPIDGRDVASELNKRKINHRQIKIIMDKVREEWSKSEFRATEDELKDFMIRQVDDYQNYQAKNLQQ